uniref:Putative secreted protein n=1 Tax=Ixodes scapularis TaxID=6945 RepID=A0A4D5RFL3_IXOSC
MHNKILFLLEACFLRATDANQCAMNIFFRISTRPDPVSCLKRRRMTSFDTFLRSLVSKQHPRWHFYKYSNTKTIIKRMFE